MTGGCNPFYNIYVGGVMRFSTKVSTHTHHIKSHFHMLTHHILQPSDGPAPNVKDVVM
jgi:hypothetical protein